jgi:hypothetical protein
MDPLNIKDIVKPFKPIPQNLDTYNENIKKLFDSASEINVDQNQKEDEN